MSILNRRSRNVEVEEVEEMSTKQAENIIKEFIGQRVSEGKGLKGPRSAELSAAIEQVGNDRYQEIVAAMTHDSSKNHSKTATVSVDTDSMQQAIAKAVAEALAVERAKAPQSASQSTQNDATYFQPAGDWLPSGSALQTILERFGRNLLESDSPEEVIGEFCQEFISAASLSMLSTTIYSPIVGLLVGMLAALDETEDIRLLDQTFNNAASRTKQGRQEGKWGR